MNRVVDFYNKLPRGTESHPPRLAFRQQDPGAENNCFGTGPPSAAKPSGLIGRYRARYFGDKPSATRMLPLRFKHEGGGEGV